MKSLQTLDNMGENVENKTPQEDRLKPGTEANPLGDAFNVMVSIPDKLEIKMVNASILSSYEIWVFIASLLSNAVVGFWVSFATNSKPEISSTLFWNSMIFSVLFVLTLIVALVKRYKLNSKSKSINLKTSKIEHDNNS